MNLKSSLSSLKQQIQQNKNAFKKNKQNYSLLSNQKPLKSNADLTQIKQSVKSNISTLLKSKKNSSQAYQCAIKHLKLLLQQAWTKNQFLVRDRAQVLRQNFTLKQNVQLLTAQLEQAKTFISDLKLNGYSGNQVNGMFEDGNIFKIGYDQGSRLVSQKENYSIRERKSSHSQNDSNNKQQLSPTSLQEQQSLLNRQVSRQLIRNNILDDNLSPAPLSQLSSQINQTPNYNFKSTNFDLQNINKVNNHFVDIGSEFVSQNNSCSGSGYVQERCRNNQVEISLNNLNSQLYLPINQNKQYLKQQIETFKQHLHMANGQRIDQQSIRQSQQYMQVRVSGDQQFNQSPQSHNNQTQFTYCSSTCQQGIFRAFYLSIIRYPSYRQKFYQILEELKQDDTFTLYHLYPKNEFWVQMMGSFLHWIEMDKLDNNMVLDHLNTHKLIDLLFIQSLKFRVTFLYNDCEGQLDQSSLLNGSINNNQNCGLRTNRQSVNASFQQNNSSQSQQQNSQVVLFFNALATVFDLQCKKDEKAFYFYEYYDSAQDGSTQRKPLFVIVNMQEMNSFAFEFFLRYQKSQTNSSRAYRIDRSQQMHEYENSVKKQFDHIKLNGIHSQQKNSSNNSNLLNSCSNSQEKYLDERSFVSQTNQYEDEDQTEQTYADSHNYNFVSQNISYNFNNTAQTTQRSLRTSINDGSYNLNSQRGRQLRQRPINYNTMSHNYPIQQELIQTQSKQLLYTSFGKSPNNLSKLSSIAVSPNISTHVSRVINEKNALKQKRRQRYDNQNIFEDNFILNKIKSVQSEDNDQVLNDDYEYEDDEDDQPFTLNLKIR